MVLEDIIYGGDEMKKVILLLLAFLLVFIPVGGLASARYGIVVNVETDKIIYEPGELVRIKFTMVNKGVTPVKLVFNTTQLYDFAIFDAKNNVVFRWSQGKMFAQKVTEINITPGEERVFEETWDQKTNAGSFVNEGNYKLQFMLTTSYDSHKDLPAIGKFNKGFTATTLFSIGSQKTSPFSDVTDPELIYYLNMLYLKGIVRGYPDGTFRPENPLTRAEAIVMILRSCGINPMRYFNPSFNDVPRNHWALDFVEEAFKRNIIKGVGPRLFAPAVFVTKGQFVVMVMRAFDFETIESPNPFYDLKENYFGYKEIITAYNLGLSEEEFKDGLLYFYPNKILSRGEAVIILGKAVEKR